ncbi:unnamed protein product [Lactuca saligna]|uniref:Uncharacterized protein n=1 Tax=Lactuca saligna TaxID=75948 RepID=A0AA35VKM1_LACSI|nr:unnamed protein product [Lactuca saligna]
MLSVSLLLPPFLFSSSFVLSLPKYSPITPPILYVQIYNRPYHPISFLHRLIYHSFSLIPATYPSFFHRFRYICFFILFSRQSPPLNPYTDHSKPSITLNVYFFYYSTASHLIDVTSSPSTASPPQGSRPRIRLYSLLQFDYGPPKDADKFAWKPNAGVEINETEVGGRFRPLSNITGVCPKCKDQINGNANTAKYKPLTEPAKCDDSSFHRPFSFNLTDFGAVGDGITLNTKAFEDAVSTISKLRKRVLLFLTTATFYFEKDNNVIDKLISGAFI